MVLLQFRRISFHIQRFFADESIMKYLCVAEKHDAAKNIAGILSKGNANRKEGLSRYNKIFTFQCEVNGTQADIVMTSVSGHLLNYSFQGAHKSWHSCNPVDLFHAPVHKICPDNYVQIRDTLQREVRRCNALIIWTDCDREGENIGFEIIEVCQQIKPNIEVFRAKFSEITARSIGRAIRNLERPNQAVSDAVNVRSELDLRTGAAFTRLQTLRLQKVFPDDLESKIISYGSCQFPTLGFVVERYKAIENFIPEQFWQIHLSHTIKKLTTDFTWKRNRLFDKSAVLALLDLCLQTSLTTIESVESKPKSKWRPLPLDTVEMEKIISRKMRISAKNIMQVAEKLYTAGYISYPRTETNIFPKEMDLGAIVQQQTGDPEWGEFAQRVINEGGPTPRQGKKSDQAHPPIHPTKYVNDLVGNEKRVYDYIVRHFLACVHKDAKGHETIVQADCAGEKFTAKGLVILERNYLDVYTYETWNGKEIHEYQIGDSFIPTRLELGEGITSPPKLLTEADLIALMEKHGIGTDATHAEHIEKVKERDYVSMQQNIYFVPAALGMGLVEGYNNMELQISLAKPNLRSDFENDLKQICDGHKRAADVLRDQIAKYAQVFQIVANKMAVIDGTLRLRFNSEPRPYNDDQVSRPAQKPVLKCPKCGADMYLRARPNGAGWYLGCANYPDCKNAVWFTGVLSAQSTDDTCPTCGPNVRMIKINFRQNPFIGEPNPNVLCIGGCDAAILSALDIMLSRVKKVNAVVPPPPARVQGNIGPGFRNQNNGVLNPSKTSVVSKTAKSKTPQLPSNQSTISSWVGVGNNSINTTNTTLSINPSPQYLPVPQSSGSSTHTSVDDGRAADTQMCNCNQEAVLLTCRNGVNAGRQFYKCPANTPTGGGCKFFAWEDDAKTASRQNTPNGRNNMSTTHAAHTDDGDDDDKKCQCGLDAVQRIVSKDGPNKGRNFFACPKPMGQGCNFFQWAKEPTAGRTNSKKRGARGGSVMNQNDGMRTKRKCGLCHQEGHTRTRCFMNKRNDENNE